ncbi:MAG: hypothetical protein VB031_01890 [Eubacteriaceae bacterium]|nr:hypothetical protein [Eubacteriaceae bacterium]
MKKRSSRTAPVREGDPWAGRFPGEHSVKVALEFAARKRRTRQKCRAEMPGRMQTEMSNRNAGHECQGVWKKGGTADRKFEGIQFVLLQDGLFY